MIYFCCEEGRRSLVRGHPTFNAIDYLEVVDVELKDTPQEPLRQRILLVFFVGKAETSDAAALAARRAFFDQLTSLPASQVRIWGGERVKRIEVDEVELHSAGHTKLNAGDQTELTDGDHLEIRVTPRGDFSRYTLALVEPNTDDPLALLDPMLARVDFSFKVECESDFDCRADGACPPEIASAPDLDYLAKDYASFRQLMLDRLALLEPEWRERNPADLGVSLVELLAYVGDYLSYRQDAIGTEAYLGTARRRVSLRRHTRLLDYAMHDGCNARAWVQVRLKPATQNGVVLAVDDDETARPRFVTRLSDAPVLAEQEFQRLAAASSAEIFEPMERAHLFHEHNEMFFHTWGDAVCCLPKGATKARLTDDVNARLRLRPGDVLVFTERIGPRTGDPADADPARRHAVRLMRVEPEATLVKKGKEVVGRTPGPLLTDPLTGQPYVNIEWYETDALPAPFCLSARAESGGRLLNDVSVALGNIVLADHGMTLPEPEDLGRVPTPNPVLTPVSAGDCGHCDQPERLTTPPRFRPQLAERPLTQAAGYDSTRPAAEAFAWEMQEVLPAIHLKDNQGRRWKPQHDLLSSDAFAPEFVAEVENDGLAFLRFGDDENGMSPAEGTKLEAVYRVGNGARGNLGTEALVHLVADTVLVPDARGKLQAQPAANFIESVTNWLPARRGTEPESLEEVRQNSPAAFRVQQRAVTPVDYEEKAGEHPDVQRAAATLRWTGSWYTIFLTVDRRGGRLVDAPFEQDLRAYLERYRMAGHDLEIDGPRFVPLELEMRVCVAENYFQSDAVAALETAFDNRLHADGSRGFFHPDNFTFGQPVLFSRIYAVAMRIEGVRHVEVTILRQQGQSKDDPLPEEDVFEIGRLEIARLDNDPNFPDRGVLRCNPVGGR